ncbi:MAG: homocysteine S-methyltransferase family protein [Desulfocapsaceae bacterium]|nr:homocysteine S-methyltransferase family protein [Desulfocapsaceae bacterium]
MSTYREKLPQLDGRMFITDGGLETTLYFDKGYDLQDFAAFPLIESEEGRRTLIEYYQPYIELARDHGFGCILESPTWRASKYWGNRLGYDTERLAAVNSQSIALLARLRGRYRESDFPIVISGCLGPRRDGYQVQEKMNIDQARKYHAVQIGQLNQTEADLVSAFTINYSEEAIGITLAAQDHHIPVVISFTLETDGRLPSGQPLGAAIEEIDNSTDLGPSYYMINCAHPSHFRDALLPDSQWKERIRAVRANASAKSHAELEEAEELDNGNPKEFGKQSVALTEVLPGLNIFGGCCGTDVRHLTALCTHLSHSTLIA